MKVQVRINEEGALRNQRHAFSGRFTVVSELLQNARRAGATQITLTHDAAGQVLTVEDDGGGIQDFQKLLSLHESGWEALSCHDEHCFGVGFSSCLYAAHRCIVTSGSQRIEFDTAAALSKAPIEVEQTCVPQPGTRVELHGVQIHELAAQIEKLCEGFPIDVHYNGRALVRPFAPDRLDLQPCAVGTVHLAGRADGRHSRTTLVFLHGFCVMRPAWYAQEAANVVHLDPRVFMARLPDRDKLIDEDRQRKRIDLALHACWRETLDEAKRRLAPVDFAQTFYAAMRSWNHLAMLNDVEALPEVVVRLIEGYPVQSDHCPRDYLHAVNASPTRAEIEGGTTRLVALGCISQENAAHWMFARGMAHLVVDWLGLDAAHWVQAHVRHAQQLPIRLEAIHETARTQLVGRWVHAPLILCETVHIRVGDELAVISDAAVVHHGVIYVPAGESSGEAVRQLSSYRDGSDRYLQSDMEADCETLADLIRHLRSCDPLVTLDALIREMGLARYPCLHGATFQVSIGSGAAPGHFVALCDARRGPCSPATRAGHAGG